MQSYTEILNRYLAENPPKTTHCNIHKLLDMLYCCYSRQKAPDEEEIRQTFRRLDALLAPLPLPQQGSVVDTACDLCVAYQKEGFQDGILIGFRLFSELS